MQLTCPSCGSRYRIDASSWPTEPGPDGESVLRARKARCKLCREVWLAVPEEEALELDDPLPPEEGPRPAAWASIGGWPDPRPVEPTLAIPPPVFAAPMVLAPVPLPPMVPRSSFPPPAPADLPLQPERVSGPSLSPAASASGERGGRVRLPGPASLDSRARVPEAEAADHPDVHNGESHAPEPLSGGWSQEDHDADHDADHDEDYGEDYGDDDRPRRWWLWVLGLLVALAVIWTALVLTGRVRPQDYGLPVFNPAALRLPDWADPSGIGLGSISVPQAPLPPLALVVAAEKRRIADDRLVWDVRGSVTNPTDRRHAVPPLELLLLDKESRIVGRWTVRPDPGHLGPGEVAQFETSAIDPPEAAIRLRVQMKPQGLGRV